MVKESTAIKITTIVLPGYSISNKDWAEEVAAYLNSKGVKTIVHYWEHWKEGVGTLQLNKELQKLSIEITEPVNIIAKSVGTMIAAKFMEKNKGLVNKLILCGFPSTSVIRWKMFIRAFKDFVGGHRYMFLPSAVTHKQILRQTLGDSQPDNILCIQNTNDPFASYSDVSNFISKINPKIKVLEMPRNDHKYPYFIEFENFLKR